MLVVEDDPEVAELVAEALADDGYAVDTAGDGEEAAGLLNSFPYDLVLLDVMLPGRNGFECIREWRAEGFLVPVLMLTARDTLDDRVNGLEGGADDYLVKPFHLKELRARVRALLRRAYGRGENRVTAGRLTLDLEGRRAWWQDQEIHLSGREYALLVFLALNQERHYPREVLLEHVWPGESMIDARTVDTYIRYLRRKLGDDSIETVRGLGYRFMG
jgi:two-component system OmpR family response regulator/two-component system response regulator QseB